jgi:hypothetical protein
VGSQAGCADSCGGRPAVPQVHLARAAAGSPAGARARVWRAQCTLQRAACVARGGKLATAHERQQATRWPRMHAACSDATNQPTQPAIIGDPAEPAQRRAAPAAAPRLPAARRLWRRDRHPSGGSTASTHTRWYSGYSRAMLCVAPCGTLKNRETALRYTAVQVAGPPALIALCRGGRDTAQARRS